MHALQCMHDNGNVEVLHVNSLGHQEVYQQKYTNNSSKQGNATDVISNRLSLTSSTSISSTELTRFLPAHILQSVLADLSFRVLHPPAEKRIHVPSTTASKDRRLREEVATINGMALPAMLERRVGKCSMYTYLANMARDKNLHKISARRFESLPNPAGLKEIEHFLELAALYQAVSPLNNRGGYLSPILQLTRFDWIKEEIASACIQALETAIPDYKDADFEHFIDHSYEKKGASRVVIGIAAVLTPSALYEVKCVDSLTEEHFLQLAIYAWIWNSSYVRLLHNVCALYYVTIFIIETSIRVSEIYSI
jgi:hypothetical protein